MTSLLNEISALWNHFVDPPRELTLTELAELDMPDPLRVRIVATVQHQARTATIQADSEWLDMNHPNVYIDWMNFVTDHLPYAKIPQAYVRTVFDSALEDLVECCVHPRTAIVDLCFGERSERAFAEVELASRAIPVHEDLVQAMIAAVEASGAGSRDRAEQSDEPAQQSGQMVQKNDAQAAIERSDQALFDGLMGTELANIVVQRLEPLFELCKDSVDPTFLSTFVEEKGYDELAHQIEQCHEPLSKDEFVSLVTEWEVREERDERADGLDRPGLEGEPHPEGAPEPEDAPRPQDAPGPLYTLDSEHPPNSDASNSDASNSNHPSTIATQASQQAEGVPLWMQYLQDVPEEEAEELGNEVDEPVNGASEPVNDPAEPEGISSEQVHDSSEAPASASSSLDLPPTPAEKLLEHLKPIQSKIMKTLFQDDYGRYLDMIQSVCELSDWETASQWLDENVFIPQEVDLENETVITFLDRMQAYFE